MARLTTLAALAAGAYAYPVSPQHGSPWPASATAAASALLAQMNLTEKLAMVHGYGGGYVGNVPANNRLGIPPINLEDGPQGVADGVSQVTCWPSALTVVMSWNTTAMQAYGAAMGAEQSIKGTNVMLGPAVNLARVPWGGRTFEYTGEDPWLASHMVAAEVTGIQSANVSGCIKHAFINSQEYDRSGMSSDVGRRPWMELYLPSFLAAVDSGVGSAMCAYNRINRTWSCENAGTLSDFKGPYGGFRGWVMSDWGATHSTVPAALAGLDQQMPDDGYFGAALAAAVAAGQVPESRIDDMVMRMLTPMYALNLMSDPPTPARNLGANATSDAHNALARDLAEESITLLKNDGGFLPISPTAVKTVVVLGDDTTVHGDGSGGVSTPYVITPFSGVYTLLNGPYTPPPRPANCVFYNDTDFYQPGNPCVGAASAQDCCAACSADPTCNAFAFVATSTCATGPRAAGADGACWKKPDTTGNKTAAGIVAGTCPPQPPPPAGAVNVTSYTGQNASVAAALAAGADLVIVNVATKSSEGSDRADLSLPAWQDALVAAVAAANPKTVVVARCPGACFMPWASAVPAILFQLMPGQESGNALAAAIFGAVNPSGKLPVSFPASMNGTWLSSTLGGPVDPARYPGVDEGGGYPVATYAEGLAVGYRFYLSTPSVAPAWPFGHGLSYTTFSYTGLTVTGSLSPSSPSVTVSLTVTNTGAVAGKEVVQLYITHPAAAGEPSPVLKGFTKVALAPGASAPVTFTVAAVDVAIFDVVSDGWLVVPGTYGVAAAASSVDFRATGSFTASD